jgi:hypothetical protein
MTQRPTAKPGASQRSSVPVNFGQFKAEIEKRAKEIFIKRQTTKAAGDTLSDWLQAEKEIKAKYHIA